MPPRLNSRYQYSRAFQDDDGRWHLELSVLHRFRNEPDNTPHTVGPGDTLQILAYRYFRSFVNPARLWWVIAEFNDIIDATARLVQGTILIIPSERLVRTLFLAPPADFQRLLVQLGGGS